MARPRSCRIDPLLDLSGRLLTFEQLPRPWDARALFGRGSPLEVEVGSGKGLFLRTAASQRPEVDFLGIEIARGYARFAAAALVRAGLTNASVVAADAVALFRDVFPDGSLAAVHVYFPDPWWKRRHRKRRLMRESFVRDVERSLEPGGRLHFWTDVEEYFHVSLELLADATSLQGPWDVPSPEAPQDADYRTHFERRTRLGGAPVYRAEFRKPKGTNPAIGQPFS